MLVHHSGRDYNEAASEAAAEARKRMEAIIEGGRQSALMVHERVNNHVPVDRIAKGKALRFGYVAQPAFKPAVLEAKPLGDPALTGLVNDEGIPLQVAALLDGEPQAQSVEEEEGPSKLVLEIADSTKELIHSHALTQIAGKAGIPSKYLKELAESGNPILQSLALEILDTHYRGTDLDASRFLLRSVDGELRGFLSDRYRRLDNRPLLDAFIEGCRDVGAVPVDGTVSDIRVAMKAYLPFILEPVPNEVMLVGVQWGNSDFGAAAYTLSLTVLRLWCTNKAVMENSLRNVHLGARLDDSINYSERTYRLDTETNVSATRDTVRELLSPQRVNAIQAVIKGAAEKKVEWNKLSPKIIAALTKSEQELAHEMFDGSDDIVMLPPQRTIWRASNVLSWIAGRTEDADHRLDLERAAGELLDKVRKAA